MGGRGSFSPGGKRQSFADFVISHGPDTGGGGAGVAGAGGVDPSQVTQAVLFEEPGGLILPRTESAAIAEAGAGLVVPSQGGEVLVDLVTATGREGEGASGGSVAASAGEGTGGTEAVAGAGGSSAGADLGELGYVVIDQETALGGAIYPFLEQTGRAWRVIESSSKAIASYPNAHSFGMDKPTLRYVNGGKVEDIFVDGLTTEEFLARTGLELSMDKGGFVLSKRLSRVMRPYFASGSFADEDVSVKYMDLSKEQEKVWDGAGLISRDMLERLMIPEGTSPAKRAELMEEIRHCKRVEFTVMSAAGQDKGHAIVADNLEADFVLPRDTKKEVRLVNGTKFVGVNFVHSHDDMRMDIQSLINLHPFFDTDQYAQWLDDEGKLFAQAVESGDVAEAMGRIDPFDTMKDVEAWHLREYFASGGHPMWFANVSRNLMNQHLDRLNQTTLEKMRLPVPGGRYYVMPMGVGQAAGVDQVVPRGQVRIDKEHGTAWVNDEDWLAMQDSPSGAGIRDILGGADNDDALWLHPFTDHDGVQKVLAWRSPNQAGEYVILQPTLGSRDLTWKTVKGEVSYPAADSRKLFARTDTMERDYQGLVDPDSATGLGKGKPYSIEAMDEAIQRSIANAGALGMYCNMLMISKAVYGDLPRRPPAPLEDFIDASVKTGADLSAGAQWCFDASRRIVETGRPVPAILQGRLALGKDAPPVAATEDHWLDRLVGAVKTHIDRVREKRDELVKASVPPARLFDHAFNETDRKMIDVGTQLNRVYKNSLNQAIRDHRKLLPEDYERARIATEGYLGQFPEDQHGAIIRGALVSTYMADSPSDAALWMRGAKTETGHAPGMANKTLAALREIGVLDEVGTVDGKVIRYPGAMVSEPDLKRSIGFSNVWFDWYRVWQEANGQTPAATLSEIPKERMVWAKEQVAHLSASSFQNMPLVIRKAMITGAKGEEPRLVAYTERGNIFGLISRDSERTISEGPIRLGFTIAKDGNVRAVWQPVIQEE